MKKVLAWIATPLFFTIVYFNLNIFVFNFEARQNYLNKRLNKAEERISLLKNELKPLEKNKDNKQFEELSKTLKHFKNNINLDNELKRKNINLYAKFTGYDLSLISEENIKAPLYNSDKKKELNKFTIHGTYPKIISFLKSLQHSQFVPVSFNLTSSKELQTKYEITIWNRANES